jgi:uncharacterized membrane protein
MNERPKLKLELTPIDMVLEILGWTSILAIWVLTITNYSSLPDTIPIHWNGVGKADGFGGKGFILPLPIISTILFIGLTILNKYPHVFNYPTNINEENALSQYTNATRLIRYSKFIVVVIFGIIVLQTISYVNGFSGGLGVWFLPLTLGLVFVPLIFFARRSYIMAKK